jgi:hypothetical protein
MRDRHRAETECWRTEAGEPPGAEVHRQIAALYVRLAESIAAVLTGEAAKRPIGVA